MFGTNGDGMLRAALGTAFLSAVTNLIGIVNLSSCASLPPEIYRMLGAELSSVYILIPLIRLYSFDLIPYCAFT